MLQGRGGVLDMLHSFDSSFECFILYICMFIYPFLAAFVAARLTIFVREIGACVGLMGSQSNREQPKYDLHVCVHWLASVGLLERVEVV